MIGFLVEYGKAQVFSKDTTSLDIEEVRTVGSILRSTVRGEDHLGLVVVDALSRPEVEVLKGLGDSVAIEGIGSSKEGEVINKEEVRNFGARAGSFDRVPIFPLNLSVNVSRESLHTDDEEIGRHRVSLPNTSRRFKGGSFPSIDNDGDGVVANT